MSSYTRNSKHKDNKHKTNESDSTYANIVLDRKVESLIQDLKNSQRCYAEAASLVNSSQLRNFFEKIELERTMFMEKVAISVERLDLVSGRSGHSADVVWFASVEITNVSKEEFDMGILLRCLQCEQAIHQAYKSVFDVREDRKLYPFLLSQQVSLEKSRQHLLKLKKQLEA